MNLRLSWENSTHSSPSQGLLSLHLGDRLSEFLQTFVSNISLHWRERTGPSGRWLAQESEERGPLGPAFGPSISQGRSARFPRRRRRLLRAGSSDPCREFPAAAGRVAAPRPLAPPDSGRERGCARERRAQAPPGGVSAPRGGGVVGKREGAREGEGEKEAPASNLRAGGGWLWGNWKRAGEEFPKTCWNSGLARRAVAERWLPGHGSAGWTVNPLPSGLQARRAEARTGAGSGENRGLPRRQEQPREPARPPDGAIASPRWPVRAAPRSTGDAPCAARAPQPGRSTPRGTNFSQTRFQPSDQTCRASSPSAAVLGERALPWRDVRAQRRQRQGEGQEEGARLRQEARARGGRLEPRWVRRTRAPRSSSSFSSFFSFTGAFAFLSPARALRSGRLAQLPGVRRAGRFTPSMAPPLTWAPSPTWAPAPARGARGGSPGSRSPRSGMDSAPRGGLSPAPESCRARERDLECRSGGWCARVPSLEGFARAPPAL